VQRCLIAIERSAVTSGHGSCPWDGTSPLSTVQRAALEALPHVQYCQEAMLPMTDLD